MSDDLPTIRVLLVDDHPAVRQGLGLLLSSEGIEVCAEAGSQEEALLLLDECRPDLALVDLSLGGEDGLVLISRLREREVSVLVYSMHEDSGHVEGSLSAGALGYVAKRELHRVLVEAIKEVASGRRFVSPNAALALADRVAAPNTPDAARILSEQEKQVYRMLGSGDGTIEIAVALGISTRTVESYFARIMEKLHIEGMRDLRRHAISHFRSASS